MSENICDLCEESAASLRGCRFGKKHKKICPKCLGQFKIISIPNPNVTNIHRVVLEDRIEG